MPLVKDLSKLDMKTKHENLKGQLIQIFKERVELRGRVHLLQKSFELMELANCTPADFSCPSDELNEFDILIIEFADLHYRLQKKHPSYEPEVSFPEVLTVGNINTGRDIFAADLESSGGLLKQIQNDDDKSKEQNHLLIGESLRNHFKAVVNEDSCDEAWGLKIEKLRGYAGLPVSSNEDASSDNEYGQLELVWELAERIYLLKEYEAQITQSKSVETNTNGLMILSPQGQQAADPTVARAPVVDNSPENGEQKRDAVRLN